MLESFAVPLCPNIFLFRCESFAIYSGQWRETLYETDLYIYEEILTSEFYVNKALR